MKRERSLGQIPEEPQCLEEETATEENKGRGGPRKLKEGTITKSPFSNDCQKHSFSLRTCGPRLIMASFTHLCYMFDRKMKPRRDETYA